MDDQCMRYAPPDPGFWEKVGGPCIPLCLPPAGPLPSPPQPPPPYPDSCSRVAGAPAGEGERERRGR